MVAGGISRTSALAGGAATRARPPPAMAGQLAARGGAGVQGRSRREDAGEQACGTHACNVFPRVEMHTLARDAPVRSGAALLSDKNGKQLKRQN